MKPFVLIVGGIVSIVLLAAAVFVGMRLLNTSQDGPVGGGELMLVGDQGSGPVAFSLDIKPAPELPPSPPQVNGLFVRREDNSIFVGTGELEIMVEVDPATGQHQTRSDHSGPVLEVVVTRNTTLYRDETEMPSIGPGAAPGDKIIQQVVTPVDSLDELGKNSKNTELQVWGSRSGDRVVAETLVYRVLGRLK